MCSIKNACSSAPTPEQAREATCNDSLPEKEYSTSVRVASITEFLKPGADNGIHLVELMLLTGADGRTVRKAIESERRRGVPILSDNKSGYFLPTCQTDIDLFIRSMRRRAGEISLTAAAVESGGRFGGD